MASSFDRSTTAVLPIVAQPDFVSLAPLPCAFNSYVFTSQVRLSHCMSWAGNTILMNAK